jgi:hypothetical protein
VTTTPPTANEAASAHLSRIAAATKRVRDVEDDLDVLAKQTRGKRSEHTAATKQLRELVDQAAGIQALALPFAERPS